MALTEPLEGRLVAAASSSSTGIVLVLGACEDEVQNALEGARRALGRRLLHVPLAPTIPLLGAARDAALAAVSTRLGAATLLDPLLGGAASFVLGQELAEVGSSLEPDALDATPARAANLVAKRFLPALSSQLPQVPFELLAALARVRCAGPADAPELLEIARSLEPRAFLASLGAIATRAEVVILLALEDALDRPASAVAAALELPRTSGLAVSVSALGSAWSNARTLLSDEERTRADEAAFEVPSVAEPVPLPRPGTKSLPPRERILSARKTSGPPPTPEEAAPAAPKTTRTASPRPALAPPASPVRPSLEPPPPTPPTAPRRRSRLLSSALVSIPVLFLGSLYLLERPEPDPTRTSERAKGAPLAVAAPTAAAKKEPAPVGSGIVLTPKGTTPRAAPAPASRATQGGAWAPQDSLGAARTPEEVTAVLDRELPISATFDSRVALLDRGLAKLDREPRARALVRVLDASPSPPLELARFRRAVLERLLPLIDVPAANTRLAGLLDATVAPGERALALRAFANDPRSLSPEARDKLAVLAAGHEDSSFELQARAILAASSGQ
jgi:hypothetical protein